MYTPADRNRIINSARASGAIGRDPLVYRVFRAMAERRDIVHLTSRPIRVLDFGAGKKAVHSERLREMGFDVTAYDLSRNDFIYPPYDFVLLSNVLNVQPTLEHVRSVLEQAHLVTDDPVNGFRGHYMWPDRNAGLPAVIANFPTSPNYSGATIDEVYDVFREVMGASVLLRSKRIISSGTRGVSWYVGDMFGA